MYLNIHSLVDTSQLPIVSRETTFALQNSTKAVKGAGFHTHIFGFPRHSAFLEYVLAALRQNFPATRLTLAKTGPFFLKEAFLQYPFCDQIPLIRWDSHCHNTDNHLPPGTSGCRCRVSPGPRRWCTMTRGTSCGATPPPAGPGCCRGTRTGPGSSKRAAWSSIEEIYL